ncbi:MAG: cell division-like protein [Thiotrichales bacterium]|nr:cell division-like protein [Thiotrichales bacterium]
MNELQLVLLVFAVVVVGVLYFLSKKRQSKSPQQESDSSTVAKHSQPTQASPVQAPQSKIASPVSQAAQSPETFDEERVPDNQTSLPFGEDFIPEKPAPAQTTSEPNFSASELEKVEVESPKKANHHVLEVEELYSVNEVGLTSDDLPKPNFGIPEEKVPPAAQTRPIKEREHQVFVLMVLNTGGSGQEFAMDAVNQALLGVGLKFSKNSIYVTTDSQGTEIIRVANIMEPGTFPTENLQSHTTPGLALILELPTSMRAPAAMHDLIMMARKVSQRLNGRLYNMERHLIKESDLQAMRDAAVEYESEPL